MSAVLIVDGVRVFDAVPDSIKRETRSHNGRSIEVVSASGCWLPAEDVVWESWAAERVEVRITEEEGTNAASAA